MKKFLPVILIAVMVVAAQPISSEERFGEPRYKKFKTMDVAFNAIEGFDQELEGAQEDFGIGKP